MKYNTALPYFHEEDIKNILRETENMLRGNGLLSMGRFVDDFEMLFSEYNDSKYCIATSSCTSAIEIALSALNISRNDEVIVPAQTFIATGSAVTRLGGRPIFCEVNSNFLLDFDDMKNKINSSTKAVILVHYSGLIHENIFKIKEYLDERRISLIEERSSRT
jgi:Predicted pyridoxal phosphate-dependent enzyme apparently involved in regulation of cell wall biogenesis